jgi:hypothetical protein
MKCEKILLAGLFAKTFSLIRDGILFQISAVGRKDLDNAEATGHKVTFWSLVYLVLLIFCSVGQGSIL